MDKQTLRDYFIKQPVVLVYLMGSHAEGRPKPYSDIDIAVLFLQGLTKEERFAKRIELIADITKMLGRDDVDIVDLAEASPLFRFEAIKHRKEIFVGDEQVRVAFETRTLSDYFDRQYYLQRHTSLGMQRLREEYGIK